MTTENSNLLRRAKIKAKKDGDDYLIELLNTFKVRDMTASQRGICREIIEG